MPHSPNILDLYSDDPSAKTTWTISAVEETPGKVLVDFSPKGGPTNLLGKQLRSLCSFDWCRCV